MAINSQTAEFYSFLDGFGKKPGEYTKEEALRIGLRYRALDRADKDWPWLAERLGIGKDGNQLRLWVRYKALSTAPAAAEDPAEKALSEYERRAAKIKEDLYKQQTKTRDTFNTYRRSLREDARLDSLKATILEAARSTAPLDGITAVRPSGQSLEAVLLISDLHIGAKVNAFYNKYDSSVAERRMALLTAEAKRYCLAHNVRKLNVLNLGDLIQGAIHVTGRIEQEMDVISQMMKAADIMSRTVNSLLEAAPEVVYRSCTDNHSRLVADPKQNIEKENLNKIIDWYVKAKLAGTKVEFKDDNLSDDIGMFEMDDGKICVFVHGNKDKDFANTLMAIGSQIKKPVDYLFLGHVHSTNVRSIQNALVFTNASVMGADAYSSSLRLYGPAAQTLLMFDGENVMDCVIKLA